VSEEDIYSKFTRDYDADQVPSYSDALAARTSPYVWPNFLGKDTDPSEYLKQMDIPGLWIFGAQDGSVPIDLSVQNLDALIKTKPHYEYILFSKSGHNNLYETFATANDWIIRLSQE
jgi:pimeloyl-ACP methyl ester carboxylesterase